MIYHLWLVMQDDPELTAVVRSRQLHIYRNLNPKNSFKPGQFSMSFLPT